MGVAERVATPTEATCGAGWSSATCSPPSCDGYAPVGCRWPDSPSTRTSTAATSGTSNTASAGRPAPWPLRWTAPRRRRRLLAAWATADAATPPAGTGRRHAVAAPRRVDRIRRVPARRRLAGGEITLTPGADRRLVHEWLVADTPHTVEIAAGRRIGAGMVDTVTRRVAQLRRVDDHIGGRELRPLVERELRATAGLLRHAAYTDPVGRALLGAVAELCQLAGWVLADAAAPDAAARYHLLGVHAAHTAGARPTAANLVSILAYQVANMASARGCAPGALRPVRGPPSRQRDHARPAR